MFESVTTMEIAYFIYCVVMITLFFIIQINKANKEVIINDVKNHEEPYITQKRLLFQRLSEKDKNLYKAFEKGLAYELQIADYYRSLGYRVENRYMLNHDGGIDVIARKSSEIILIQCKNYNTDKYLNTDLIKKFIGDSFVYISQNNLNSKKVKLHFICSCNLSNNLIPKYIKFAKNSKLNLSLTTIPFVGIKRKYLNTLTKYVMSRF